FLNDAVKFVLLFGAALGRPQLARGFPGRARAAPTGMWRKGGIFHLYTVQMALNIWKYGV
ncbi:MAG: hypothetical protein LUC35_03910, partial [Clostridiales bacterium]|nr:hypothetical protein [Clostridiales bacterium]